MEGQNNKNIITYNKVQINYSSKKRRHETRKERQEREFKKLPEEWKKSVNKIFDKCFEEIKLQVVKETKEENKNEQL